MAVLLINGMLTAAGKNPIPFDENAFTDVAMQVVAGIAAVWTWWKNNNVTEAAADAQAVLNAAKHNNTAVQDTQKDDTEA